MLDDNEFMEKFIEAHRKEIEAQGAEAFNFGWAVTNTGIASKTSIGILNTEADPKTGEITHTWG